MQKEIVVNPALPLPPLPYAQAIKAESLLFLSGMMATDFHHAIAPAARVSSDFPYYGSPAKQETSSILGTMKALLAEAGCSLADVLRVGTYHRDFADLPDIGDVRREYWPANPPAATAIEGALPIPAVRLAIDAVAAVPGSGARAEAIVDDRLPHSAVLSQAYKANGLVFAAGFLASDFQGGLAQPARVNLEFPYHSSPIKQQTRYVLDRIGYLLDTAGTALDQVVRAFVVLTDLRDLFAFEEVWREYFPTAPPARTVVQSALARPGCVVEVEVTAAVLAEGVHKEVITVDGVPLPLGHESLATRAGSFVFVGGQLPTDWQSAIADEASVLPEFTRSSLAVKQQVQYVLGNMRKILVAAGTSLENAVMVHAYYRHIADLFPAFEVRAAAFGSKPPASTDVEVSGLPVSGARVMIDCCAVVE